MAESELDRAAAEYASQASPFAGLQDFLLNRPVFDRGAGPTPTTPTLRTLDFADDAAKNQAQRYREMLAEQKAEQEALLNERFEDLIQRQRDAESGQTAAREAAISKLDELQNQARERGLTDLADRLGQAREAGFDELENLTREAREQGLGDLEAALTEAQQAGQAQIIQAQEASEARQISARDAALAELRQEVEQETASAAAAQAAERSEVVKALEERLTGVKESLQAESETLKAQGIEERANIKAEQQKLVDTLQSNIDKAKEELADSQQRVKEAQDQAIGSLEDRQTSLIDDVKSRISDLGSTLTDTKQEINQELDRRDEQLTGSQKAAAEAVQGEIDSVRNDLVAIQSNIEAETKSQTDALRTERENLLGNIENSVAVLKGNIEGLPIEDIQARLNELKTETDNLVGTASEQRQDLFRQIEALKEGQISEGQVSESIQNALRDGTLTPEQIDSALDNLRAELGDARSAEIENLRAATETGRADLSSQISALNNALEGRASAEDLARLQRAFEGRGQDLGRVTEALQQGVTQRGSLRETIEALRSDFEGRGQDLSRVTDALQQGVTQRGTLGEQIQALQAAQLDPAKIEQQRQAAITGAIDPISQQIEQLRGEIPQQQQIDVDALRQQIRDEIMGSLPPQRVAQPVVSAGVGADGMPSSQSSVVEPDMGGYDTAASMNVSDGRADQMGYFDNYQNRGGTRPAAPVAAPQVAVAPPPQVAIAPPPQVAATTPPSVAVAAPPPVQPIAGVAGIPKQTLFDPMSLRFPNMRMR
jgi:DNA repair exonuclease SbcCD ATPase subunit